MGILLWPLATAAAGVAAMFQTTGGAVPPARWQFRQQPDLQREWRVELSRFGLRAVTPNQDSIVTWSEDRRIVLLW